jgi:hypothetical protein
MKRSYIQIDGVLYEKGTEPRRESVAYGPTIIRDIEPFISPIDRTVVSSRSGIRDHCARHNVVQTDELKGMKPPSHQPKPAEVRQAIVDTMYRKGYLKP